MPISKKTKSSLKPYSNKHTYTNWLLIILIILVLILIVLTVFSVYFKTTSSGSAPLIVSPSSPQDPSLDLNDENFLEPPSLNLNDYSLPESSLINSTLVLEDNLDFLQDTYSFLFNDSLIEAYGFSKTLPGDLIFEYQHYIIVYDNSTSKVKSIWLLENISN